MHVLKSVILFVLAIYHCSAGEWTEFSAILKPSSERGIGLFVTHDIPKGTRVFGDCQYRMYKLNDLPEELRKYCHYLSEEDGLGPERFDRMEAIWYINHSKDPNVMEIEENVWIAVKDIQAGEELFMDYNQLGEPDHLKEWYYNN